MSKITSNTLRAVLTASIIVAGFAATSDAAELRKKSKRLQVQRGVQMQNSQSGAGNFADNGYADAKPDLIIVPKYNGGNNGLPNTGYCGPWNGGQPSVIFYVKNAGNKMAAASDVYIGFGGGLIAIKPVPAIGAGQQVQIGQLIPPNAWSNQAHPSVNFLIAADHNDDLDEESVANNYGQSTCIGPAT